MTDYLRDEFNRAEALANDKQAGTVGFALTILQRRLASSPEAIYQSLRRRSERLQKRLRELELLQRGAAVDAIAAARPALDAEDVEDLEDAPDNEVEATEEEILDQATAARTIDELKAEIATLARLESLAHAVRRSGEDRKWLELASLLGEIFTTAPISKPVADSPNSPGAVPPPTPSPRQKLVVFTEDRDTLSYLETRVTTLLGRKEAVVIIHRGMGREERMKAQESFRHDPEVNVLIATDAAGEGINLQRAHLMVNYDLPWNPNRIEQRFGRIHRIGQTEVCPISKQMLYVELDVTGQARHLHYAPNLDYRPLRSDEPGVDAVLARPESAWITRDLEQKALVHAIAEVVPDHLQEMRARRIAWIDKARAAVKDRLTKEIGYWDHRAESLKLQEQAGKTNARLNSQEARRRG